MKKLTALFLCAAMLVSLSGCELPGLPSKTDSTTAANSTDESTAATTPTTETTTPSTEITTSITTEVSKDGPTIPVEDITNARATILLGINEAGKDKSGDEYYKAVGDYMLEEIMKAVTNKDIATFCAFIESESPDAYTFLNEIEVDGYEVHTEKSVYSEDGTSFCVKIKVGKSDSDKFAVGDNEYLIAFGNGDTALTVMFKRADAPSFADGDMKSTLCVMLSTYVIGFNTVDSLSEYMETLSSSDYANAVHWLYHALPCTNRLTDTYVDISAADLTAAFYASFGIADIDCTLLPSYNAETGTISSCGHGAAWIYSDIRKVETNGSKTTITIDYYADTCYIAVAKTMRYVIETDANNAHKFVSAELVADNGFDVASLSM